MAETDLQRATDVIERLRNALLTLEREGGAPRVDAEWLRSRCDDSLAFAGQLRRDSIRQLRKDVADFVEEFPGSLPDVLVDELMRIER